jgi:hypothetical protein
MEYQMVEFRPGQSTRGLTGKFPGGRVETEGEQAATFGVFAVVGVGHQTINQITYAATLHTARSKI